MSSTGNQRNNQQNNQKQRKEKLNKNSEETIQAVIKPNSKDNKKEDKKEMYAIHKMDNYNNKYQHYNKKPVLKHGRTLLIKSNDTKKLENINTDDLVGFIKASDIVKDTLRFLTFDNSENAYISLKILKRNPEFTIRFGYYKVFFIISGLTDESNYTEVKFDLIRNIKSKIPDANILYCKFYNTNGKYSGSGDLTVDTVDTMMKLIDKDDSAQSFCFNDIKGAFFRFNNNNNNKKNKNENNNTNVETND